MTLRNTLKQRNRNHLIFSILIIFNIILFLYFYIFSLHSAESNVEAQVPRTSWQRYFQNTSTRKKDNADTDITLAISDFERTNKLKGNEQTSSTVDPLSSKPLISMHSSNLPRTNREPIKYQLENENDVIINKKKNLAPEEFDGITANVNVGSNGEISAQVNEELTAEEDDHDSPGVINNVSTARNDGVNIPSVNRESTSQENKANIFELGQTKASTARTNKANIPNIDINRESTAPKYTGNIPNFGISEGSKVNIPDFGRINESTAQKNVNISKFDQMAINSPSIFPKEMNKKFSAQRYNGSISNFGINNESTAQGNQANITIVGSENNQMNTPNVSMNNKSILQDHKANITNIRTNEESIAQNHPDAMNKDLFIQKYNGTISQLDVNKKSTIPDNKTNISSVGINTPSIVVNNREIISNVSTAESNQIIPNIKSMDEKSIAQNNGINFPGNGINQDSTARNNRENIPNMSTDEKSTTQNNEVNIPNIDRNEKSIAPEENVNIVNADLNEKSTSQNNEVNIPNIDRNEKSIAPEENVNIVNADLNEKSTSQEHTASGAEFDVNKESTPQKAEAIITAQEDAERISHFL